MFYRLRTPVQNAKNGKRGKDGESRKRGLQKKGQKEP